MQLKSVRFTFNFIAILTLIIVLVGGVTRLTHSGLSIVDWKPISGIIPPTSHEKWVAEFTHYQQYPEYQKMTLGIPLSEFKRIYFWEYLHRVLARLLGLVALLGFFWVAFRKDVAARYKWALLGSVVWVAAQGLMGWWMVKSGLVNRPSVSHFRLAAHLGLAFGLFIYCRYWLYQLKNHGVSEIKSPKLRVGASLLFILVAVQIIYGAFTSGLKAGIGYNTWPLMEGQVLPPDAWRLLPIWHNFLENPVMVQFIHRTLGLVILAGVVLLWWLSRGWDLSDRYRKLIRMLLSVTALQVILGIVTLVMMVPLHAALTHQIMALILLMSVALLVF